MNEDILNLIFDELKICKAHIHEIQKNIDHLKHENTLLKTSLRLRENIIHSQKQLTDSLQNKAYLSDRERDRDRAKASENKNRLDTMEVPEQSSYCLKEI